MAASYSTDIGGYNRRRVVVLAALFMLVAPAAPVVGTGAATDSTGGLPAVGPSGAGPDVAGPADGHGPSIAGDAVDRKSIAGANADGGPTAKLDPDREQTGDTLPNAVQPTVPNVGGNETSVTLISGQTVRVVEIDGEPRYDVDTDKPMHTVRTPDGTYVFPEGVDFDRFDPELFNVARLIEDGYADDETDGIPVIIREDVDRPDRGDGVGAQGDRRPDDWVGVSDAFERGMAGTAGLEVARSHASIGAVSGSIDKAGAERAFEQLRDDDSLERVHYDAKYEVQLDDAGGIVSAEDAWAEYNTTGEGVTVAVLDTGVDSDHPDLQDAVILEKDFTGEDTTDDTHGHGTHVAGIVAGSGAASDGKYAGIAPNASIMDLRVLGSDGYGSSSDIIDAIEYADRNDADVVSMSLGGSTDSNDPFFGAIDTAVANGTTVVVAAGNDGDDDETIGSPGVVPSAITVGASDDADTIASFSSRGPTPLREYTKPDLVAPGVNIYSANAGTDGYTWKSGTSMATPVVSGGAALVIEAGDDPAPTEVKSRLVTTTDDIGNYDVYTAGSGRLNASRAIEADVVIDRPTTDFQSISAGETERRTVEITNVGEEQRTLDVSAAATSLDGSDGNVDVNRTQVTIAPGETAAVELQVTADTAQGTYSGHIQFDEYRANFGYLVDAKYTLTVEKSAIDSSDVGGDTVFLYDHDRSGSQYDSISATTSDGSEGEATVGVLDGNYTVYTAGVDESTGQLVIMAEKVTITESTTVTFDESRTVAYSLDTSDPESVDGELNALRLHARLGTVDDTYSHYHMWRNFPDDRTVRFSEGPFNASVAHLLAPDGRHPDEERHLDTPAAYHLFHQTEGVDGDETYVAERDQLAEENVTYYRGEAGETYDVDRVVDNPILNDPIGTGQWSLRDRETQTIYATPNDAPSTPSYRLEVEDEDEDWITRSAEEFTPAGGVESPVAVNKHPYTGTASVDVGEYADEDNVRLSVNPQVSQGPVRGVLEARDDSTDYTVTRDGSVVDQGQTDGPTVSYGADDSLSEGTTYEIVAEAGTGDRLLSTSTRTAVRTTYSDGGDNTPPAIADVSPPELSTENGVPTGPVEVDLTIEDDNPEDLTVLVRYADGTVTSDPYDGSITDTGDDWHDASVTAVDAAAGEYQATIDTDLGTDTVHLEVAVLDEGGNAISTAAYDAVAVDDREAGGVVVSNASLTDGAVRAGETAEATATVENTDEETADFEAEFRLTDEDGGVTTIASETVTLDPGEETGVTLSGTVDEAGTYDADVSGEPAGTLTVDGPAVFELSEGGLNRTEIEPGETVEATATAENVGDESGTFTAELEVNGTVEKTTDVTLSGGESTAVAFTYEPPETGEYGVRITGDDNAGGETVTDAGTLTIAESGSAEFSVSNADTSEDTVLEGESLTVSADVENVGDETGTFTAELQIDDAAVDSTAVELAPGESTTVSFDWTFDEAGTYDLAVSDESAGTLTVEQPATFETSDASLSATEIEAGETVDVTATVENVGDREGTHTAELLVDGSVEQTTEVTLAGGDTETLTFTRPFAEAGEYDVEFTDVDAGILTVEAPADIEVTDATLSEGTVLEGDTVEITATVENHGDREGTRTLELTVDGNVVDSTEVTLAGGDSTTVSFEGTFENAGTYDVAVDDESLGSVDVLAPADLRVRNATLAAAEVDAGETAEVIVTVENDGDVEGTRTLELRVETGVGNETVTTENVTLAPGASTNVTLASAFEDPGDYVLYVGDRLAGELTVRAPDDGDSDGGDDDSDGGDDDSDGGDDDSDGGDDGNSGDVGGGPPPSSGGGSGSGVDDDTPEPVVSIDRSGTDATVSVTDPSPGEPVEIDLSDAGDGSGSPFVHSGLQLSLDENAGDFQLDISSPTSEPREVPEPTSYQAIGYVRVEKTDVENEDIEEARFEFGVRTADLPDGAGPEDVRLLRHHDGEWQELETEHEDGDAYSAVSPGFSEFAVSVERSTDPGEPTFEVVESELEDRTVAPGDEFTTTATIENVGDDEGTHEVELFVDGDVADALAVSLAPDASETVALSTSLDEPGTYQVRIGDAGEPVEVIVERVATATADADADSAESVGGDGGDEGTTDDVDAGTGGDGDESDGSGEGDDGSGEGDDGSGEGDDGPGGDAGDGDDESDDDDPVSIPDVPRSLWLAGLAAALLAAAIVSLLVVGPELFAAPVTGSEEPQHDRTAGSTTDISRASIDSGSSDVDGGTGASEFDWIDAD